ncbi:T9SS type A sorting domain-containing protein [Spirosoma soli]|uniref:T9SS type A sorting domain-containing protein n=1 Tax=Spirosoma soli TaxID=1770529 RepID=A0ABW5LZG2_9BACT
MNSSSYRSCQVLLLVLFISLGVVKAQTTLTLSYGDPAADPSLAFDGNVFQVGNMVGDAPIFAKFGGTGTRFFQIESPGEGKTITVTKDGFFSIRPTTSTVIDQSKIKSFTGVVSGSINITVKPLSITTVSANVATDVTPGTEITASYVIGSGRFPSELTANGFKLQLLTSGGTLIGDLINSNDQYSGREQQNASVGGVRYIKGTIPGNTASGSYRVRVVTQGLNADNLTGSQSSLFTVKANMTPAIIPGSVGTGSYCAGSTVSFPFSTTGTFPAGNSFKVQLIDVTGAVLQDLPGISSSSPIRAVLPTWPSNGNYRFRLAATATNVVSATSKINVAALPTMTISGSSTITAGATAPVQLTFTGTPPWSVTYIDNGLTRTATSSVSSTTVTPTFTSSTFYDRAFIRSFRDAGCGAGDSISGYAQITVTQLTITTGTLSGTYCPGTAIPVSFTASGSLPNGAVNQVQISDINGNFQNGLVIGSSTGTNSITAIIPQSITPGTGYRIRVVLQSNNSVNAVASNIIIGRPDAPKVSDVFFCEGTTTTLLSATGVGSFKWYSSSSDPQPLTGAPTPPNDKASIYYVSQTANGCESLRAAINVTPIAVPAAPTISSVSLCQGAQGQFPASISGVSWYTAVTGGTPSAQPPVINSQIIGDQTFYASQTVNGCESLRAAVKATVVAVPTSPTVTAQISICQYATPGSLTAAGTGLSWYGQSGKLIAAPTPNTSTAGAQSYSVSQTEKGCEGPRASISVSIQAAPASPVANSVSLCSGTSAVPLSAKGDNLKWYETNVSSQSLTNAPTPPNDKSSVYYVSQTVNDGCESLRQAVSVTVVALPEAPKVNSVSVCQGAQGQFSASIPGALWYSTPTGGPPSTQPPLLNSQSSGEQTVYVSQTINGCESPRAAVKAIINPNPDVPTVQSVRLCQNTISKPLTAGGVALTWYGQSGKLAGAPTPQTSTSGVQSYSVSQTVNGCESSRSTISVTVLPAPVTPLASSIRYCVEETARPLSATATAGNTIKWYTDSLGGSPRSESPSFFTTEPKVYTFYVTQTDANNCESARFPVVVSVVAPPPAPTVTATQAVCQGARVGPLTASPSTGLSWQGPGIVGSSDTAPTPDTSQPNAFTYSVVQKAGSCTSPAARIIFTVRPMPDRPLVPSTAVFCIGTTATPLSATATGRLTWYTTADRSGTPLTQVIPVTDRASLTTYYVTQKDEFNCESLTREVQVRVSAKATARLTGDGDVYPGDSTAIRIRFTGDGPWTFMDWDGFPRNATDSLYVRWVRPTKNTTYAIKNLVSACGAGDNGNEYTLVVRAPLAIQPLTEPVQLTVYPNPTVSDVSVDWNVPTRQTIEIQLFNAEGKIIRHITRQTNGQLQTELLKLSNQPAGMYYLRLTTPKNGVVTKSVVKE